MAKAARALIALHEGLHDDVRQDAGNDYSKWHPVGFGGDGLGNGPPLDAVVALGVRIAADAVAARRSPLLPISITRMIMRLRLRRELKYKVGWRSGEAHMSTSRRPLRQASRHTVLLQPIATHLLPRDVPNLVQSVFRGRSASVVRARCVFEAGHHSNDPVDSRFGDCVGVLAHVGGEGAAGGGGGAGRLADRLRGRARLQ
jgi:hypothetical protein